jgi:hypothetical protein
MRKQGITREDRLARIQRNQRVQYTFLFTSLWIPILSVLMVNHGFQPFINSMDMIAKASKDAKDMSVVGLGMTSSFTSHADEMSRYNLQQDFCPQQPGLIESLGLLQTQQSAISAIEQFESFVNGELVLIEQSLKDVNQATETAEYIVDKAHRYEWIIQYYLVLLNVINILLVIGAILATVGIHSEFYQTFLVAFGVPLFALITLVCIVCAGIMTAIAMMNAGKSAICE